MFEIKYLYLKKVKQYINILFYNKDCKSQPTKIQLHSDKEGTLKSNIFVFFTNIFEILLIIVEYYRCDIVMGIIHFYEFLFSYMTLAI